VEQGSGTGRARQSNGGENESLSAHQSSCGGRRRQRRRPAFRREPRDSMRGATVGGGLRRSLCFGCGGGPRARPSAREATLVGELALGTGVGGRSGGRRGARGGSCGGGGVAVYSGPSPCFHFSTRRHGRIRSPLLVRVARFSFSYFCHWKTVLFSYSVVVQGFRKSEGKLMLQFKRLIIRLN
jgi:hypothetical protein